MEAMERATDLQVATPIAVTQPQIEARSVLLTVPVSFETDWGNAYQTVATTTCQVFGGAGPPTASRIDVEVEDLSLARPDGDGERRRLAGTVQVMEPPA